MDNIWLKDFIAESERTWFRVFFAGKKTRRRSRDGAPLATLPPEFSSREKILKFFKRYWGQRLATQMLGNLPLTKRCGRLFVIRYDPGPLSARVRNVRLLCRTKKTIVAQTTLGGGPEGREFIVQVLSRGRDGKYAIRQRIGPRYDYRYYPPQVSRARGRTGVRALNVPRV